jgi:Tetratricopeptide repeat
VRVVRDLADAWEAAVRDQRMGLVVVEGPTGIGKTAVVQALYEQLAMRQSRPAYWPASFDGPDPPGVRRAGAADGGIADRRGGAVPRSDRAKWIYPVGIAPAEGSRPDFFWWGLSARSGECAVLGGDPQIESHVKPVAEAVDRSDRLTRDRLMWALNAAHLLASLVPLGAALAELAHDVDDLQDARGLVRTVPQVAQSRARLLDHALRRNSGTVFSVTARSQAHAAAEDDARCLGLVAGVLPLLVAVEDAQFLDPATIWLLRGLLAQSGSAGLIVLTIGTDQLAGGVAAAPGNTLADWLRAEAQMQRLNRIRLDPLTAEELTEIAIGELGTGLDPPMLARVVDEADGVPEVLYERLESSAVAEALRGGGYVDLALVPKLAGLRASMAAASAPIRRALAVASVHGRMTVRDWLCVPDCPPTDPGLASPGVSAEAVDDAIAAGWLRQRRGTQVVQFTTSHALHFALAEQAKELSHDTVSAVRGNLLAAITTAHADHSWDGLHQDVRESLLACVAEEDPHTPTDEMPPNLTAELLTLRRATGRDAATRQFLAAITERLNSGQAHPRVLIVATAEALFDEGQLDRVIQLLFDDYTRLEEEYGDGAPRTFPALHNLAAAYAAAARAIHGQPESESLYQTAARLYQSLLRARVEALACRSEQIIVTRDQYAQLLADFDHYDQALTQGRVLLDEQTATRGADHPSTLATRHQIADWTGYAEDTVSAVAALEHLLPDILRVLGPDHPDTLTVRANLAAWKGEAERFAEAAAELKGLLPDMLRVLGPDHPDTLTVRANLARWRGFAGEPAPAAAALEELLADRLRVQGRDHPDTLIARANLAYWKGEAGHLAEATVAFEELLADRLRVLGPDDARTLKTRASLASCQGEAGHPADAAAAFNELLPDVLRVLGPGHPDTLAVRKNLAYWQAKAAEER